MKRIVAVDIFRGLTICLMVLVNTPGTWTYVYSPLRHAEWHGMTPTDLVFPFFIFIMGVSMYFSFHRRLEETHTKDKRILVRKVIKRSFLIFLVGFLLNWFPFYHLNITNLRIMGVLQRIACAYLLSGLAVIWIPRKNLIFTILTLLVGYFFLLFSYGEDPFSLENNLITVVDLAVLGENHMYGGFGIKFDPEGLIGAISAASSVLIGYLVGREIKYLSTKSFLARMGIVALIILLVGYVFHFTVYPINKPLWTGSYVLASGGLAIILLGFIHSGESILQKSGLSFFFRVFGRNALFSFVMSVLFVKIMLKIKIGEASLYKTIYVEVFQPVFGNYLGSFLFAMVYMSFIWVLSYVLYRKNILIKL